MVRGAFNVIGVQVEKMEDTIEYWFGITISFTKKQLGLTVLNVNVILYPY